MFRWATALIVLISFSAALSQEWPDPKFLPPDSLEPGNLNFTLAEDALRIEFDEETDVPLRIAKLNYKGDVTPSIRVFPENMDSGLNQLGAVLEQIDSVWHVTLVNKADFEQLAFQQVTMIVSIGTDIGIIQLEVRDLNDNAPVVTLYPFYWTTYENWHGAPGFFITVDDPDTVCASEIKIFDFDVEIDKPFGLNAHRGANCSWLYDLIIIEDLDYETQNLYNLTITYTDGTFSSSATKKLTVYDTGS